MNILKLCYSSLRHNAISNIFNVLILAFGIAIIVTIIHISDQIEQRFERDLAGFDLVVGAKGSPIQLILSSVFHMDVPNGNIPLSEAERIAGNHLVKEAIPLALGDNYNGFRIVGTTPDYPKHYEATLAEGHYWQKNMQAVLGSEVARKSGLKIGARFAGAHGITEGGEEHSEFPYQVTGILAPTGTVIDRLVLTDVGSVWYIHAHHDDDDQSANRHGHTKEKEHTPEREITSLLITYKTPLAAVSLPRIVDETSSMQAASPAFEMARLIRMIGVGGDAIQAFGIALVIIAASGFFMTLFNAVNDRKYEIALLRVLGATRKKVFTFVLVEGLSLGIAGTVLGIIIGHILAYVTQCWIESSRHVTLNHIGLPPYEIASAAIAIGISVIASVIPAFIAYRVNVVEVISKGA